jgi:hypothetical protein
LIDIKRGESIHIIYRLERRVARCDENEKEGRREGGRKGGSAGAAMGLEEMSEMRTKTRLGNQSKKDK